MSGKSTVHYERARVNSGHHKRILAVMAALSLVAFIPVSVRLYQLMVDRYAYYSDRALRNQTRTTAVMADRGTIYDANGTVLACSVSVENVYLDPHELKQTKADIGDISVRLGEILTLEPDWIAEQAADIRMRYKQLASAVDTQTAQKIRDYINEKNISGIHLEPSSKRAYPLATLAAQVIGFTNTSNVGAEGIEAAYNDFLAGTAGKVITTKGNNEMDMPFSYEKYVGSIAGCDVTLTLDTTVQACLEKRMEEAIARYDVQNGAFGIVMDVNTGAVLAMATLGGYDPNAYLEIYDGEQAKQLELLRQKTLLLPQGSAELEKATQTYRNALQTARWKQWRNRVVSDGYEPGSTFKVLTLAAALDSGAITLKNHFSCSGSAHISGRAQLLHCWKSAGHGTQTTAQALQNSCNIAFANIALQLGGERFYEYVENFGILEKTGLDLFGESKGVFFDKSLVTDTKKWGTASLTSGSFGQTFKLTPIQLVRAISAVVNGGNLTVPYLVSEVVNAEGKTVLKQQPTVARRVISEQTSETMRALLKSVVTDGTAKNAAVAGFSIGGKTGTSEKIDVLDENGQPTLDKIVSFVGVAPMEDPRYIVLVALDTPSRSTGIYISGGVMAAPTVGAVMADILPYLGVAQTETEQATVTMPDLTGMTASEATAALKARNLTAQMLGTDARVTDQIPAAGQTVPSGSQAILYFGQQAQARTVKMPNFFGMTRAQAADAAGKLGLYICVTGNDAPEPSVKVIDQSIAGGTEVTVGSTVELRFADGTIRD